MLNAIAGVGFGVVLDESVNVLMGLAAGVAADLFVETARNSQKAHKRGNKTQMEPRPRAPFGDASSAARQA